MVHCNHTKNCNQRPGRQQPKSKLQLQKQNRNINFLLFFYFLINRTIARLQACLDNYLNKKKIYKIVTNLPFAPLKLTKAIIK